MNRGALIGGAVLLAVLVGFGGLYVAMSANSSGVEVGNDPASGGISIGLPKSEPDARPKPKILKPDPKSVPEGDVPDADGRTRKVQAGERAPGRGLGAEEWERLREKSANETQGRAMEVVGEFVKDRNEEDAEIVREVFAHLFATSTAIRQDVKDGAITPSEARTEMSELRGGTMRELTELLGAKDYSELQRELRERNASVF